MQEHEEKKVSHLEGWDFFGEWTPLTEKMTIERAKEYLQMWKEVILLKKRDYEFMEEQYVHKDGFQEKFLSAPPTLGIKIGIKKKT